MVFEATHLSLTQLINTRKTLHQLTSEALIRSLLPRRTPLAVVSTTSQGFQLGTNVFRWAPSGYHARASLEAWLDSFKASNSMVKVSLSHSFVEIALDLVGAIDGEAQTN